MPLPKLLRRTAQPRVGDESARLHTNPAWVAVIGAVATAVATALIGWGGEIAAGVAQIGKDPPIRATPGASSPAPLRTAVASSREGSVSVTVPEPWNQYRAQWDLGIGDVVVTGPGLRAGLGPVEDYESFDEPSLYLAASAGAPLRFDFNGQSEAALMGWTRSAAAAFRWDTFASCDLVREDRVALDGWVGTVVVWDRCLNRTGNRHWELVAVHKDGTAIVNLALNLSPQEADDVAALVLTSWRVNPDATPLGEVKEKVKGNQGLPVPAWYVRPSPSGA